jgi:ankyrin repeat protein/ketosteroid isomerase-like protein
VGFFLGLSSGPQAKEEDAVSESLPDRPDLDQLRRRAKELRDAARHGDPEAFDRFARHHPTVGLRQVTLAAAQLVIARELGFASWPRLLAAIEAGMSARRQVSALLAASVDGRLRQAAEVVHGDARIARRDLRAAVVLGDTDAARELLAVDPAAAVAIDEDRGWPPLLYACYSPWHRIDPARTAGLTGVVRLLIEAGASPDTNDGGRPRFRSALKGSVEVNNPAVTEVLLTAGANPNLGEPIVEAVGHRDHRCLRLLLAHGARVQRTWALGAAVYHNDPEAMSLLLDALRHSGAPAADIASEALPDAAANASLPVVAALLEAGANPNAADDGVSAIRLAVRAGKHDVAARLREAGATDDSTDVDRFLGACRKGDRRTAEQLLTARPALQDQLTEADRAVIVDVAATGSAEAVALMLDLGFSASARKSGDQPLHNAAYHGNAAVVQLLLERGVDVDALDENFDSTALAFATVGSGEQAGRPGDWIKTVQLLVEAGASRNGAWVSAKPPSEEIADLLRIYGIRPDQLTESDIEEQAEIPGVAASGVMAAIARHLEAAHTERDLELLGSLLHPEVHWTGYCTNKDQVLDWYRELLREGTVAKLESVEVDGDAVLLGLSVTHPAAGAGPAPPQRLHQVFTVADGQIVDIRGYPDRAAALSRHMTPA